MTSYDRRPERLRKAKRKRFGKGKRKRCTYCKRELTRASSPSGLAFTKDHVMPRALGGVKTVPCCRTCNQMKGDMHPNEWRAFTEANPGWWRTHEQKG